MGILERIKGSQFFNISSDSDELLLSLPNKIFKKCMIGDCDPALTEQYIFLTMLEEQGLAISYPNGFGIQTEDATNLDKAQRELLHLPPPWPGQFQTEIRGHSTESSFKIRLLLERRDGTVITSYQRKGPLLFITDEEYFLLDNAQLLAVTAIEKHQDAPLAERGEYENLLAISRLKSTQSDGLSISVRHFDDMTAVEPASVGISLVVNEDGSGELMPAFQGWTREEIEKSIVRHQQSDSKSLRIFEGKKILVLNEKKIEAVKEVLASRKLNKDQMKKFIEAPSAFLDAELVDLDIGFSFRVTGVEVFTHAYFGETDESGIEWFSHKAKADRVFSPTKLTDLINSEEDLNNIESQIEDALSTGAETTSIEGHKIDLRNPEAIKNAFKEARTKLANRENNNNDDEFPGDDDDESEKEEKLVLGISRNDETLEFFTNKKSEDVAFSDKLDYSAYKRSPYSYQDEGIRWLLGLAQKTIDIKAEDSGKYGALLADDMGLGKTFMCLAALREYFELQRSQHSEYTPKPVLVVAPLSLLENWKDEVNKTYKEQTFSSIVILQADADLRKFRIKGSGTELRQNTESTLDTIKYALHVGEGPNRLDMPGRLVLTTYTTLRDYHFSLARIDWSFVIFDEAQNIKNPNILATRAAKALKANFKVLATGTPVENSLADIWSLFDTAVPGWLGAYQEFRKEYMRPISKASEHDKPTVRLDIGKRLRKETEPLMLRRIKEDQLDGLPKKRIFTGDQPREGEEKLDVLESFMPPGQQATYEAVIDATNAMTEQGDGGNAVLSGLHRLRDASLHPQLVDGGSIPIPGSPRHARQIMEESGKLTTLLKILDEIKKRQEKTIVFLVNKNLQRFLKSSLSMIYGLNVNVINGDTKAVAKRAGSETRKTLINGFEAAPGFGIIIMSPIAAGTGLTIVGANNVIHLERHWNPAKEAQATDRVYRIGQKRTVNVYLPILKHPDPDATTFDQNLNKLLTTKVALKDAVVTPQEVAPEDLGESIFKPKSGPTPTRLHTARDLASFSWEKFEAFSAVLLGKYYDSESMLTKNGADRKADVLLRGDTVRLVQAKHTTTKKLTSVSAIQEIAGAKTAYEKELGVSVDELIVITNASKFDSAFKKYIKHYDVVLFDFKMISKLLQTIDVSEKEVLIKMNSDRIYIS